MGLPTINIPTYELTIPSSKEEIKYRPFLVKEEKMLLLALEEDDEKQVINTVRQIVNNCTFETLEVMNMPTFDLEYVFLNIRAKSIGEVVTVSLLCEDDNETYVEVEIPLTDIQIKHTDGHTNIIDLNDIVKMEMEYPTFEMVQSITGGTPEELFAMINNCVKRIIDGETVYERSDFSKKELNEFIDGLNSKQFKDIQDFFETMPKLSHEVEFTNPNTNKINKTTLEGLQSFFD